MLLQSPSDGITHAGLIKISRSGSTKVALTPQPPIHMSVRIHTTTLRSRPEVWIKRGRHYGDHNGGHCSRPPAVLVAAPLAA